VTHGVKQIGYAMDVIAQLKIFVHQWQEAKSYALNVT